MKLDRYFIPITKVNSKWIKNLNIRSDTIKLLEENTGRKLLDIGLGNTLMDRKLKAETTKAKVNKWDYIKPKSGTSLVAQWLRIRLPMQGTWVPALVWEDPTCRGATKPVRHNYWAWALEPVSHNYWAHVPQLLKPMHLEPVLRNKRSHCSEKSVYRNKE